MAEDNSIRPMVLTIGHADHETEFFVEGLLKPAGVACVIDARTRPISRKQPQFNRKAIADILQAAGIAYEYQGYLLGEKPGERNLYSAAGIPDFPRMAKTPAFRKGMEIILEKAAVHTLAIMCAPRDPAECHRGLHLAQELARHGVQTAHILPGRGNPLKHEDLLKSLTRTHKTASQEDAVGQQTENVWRAGGHGPEGRYQHGNRRKTANQMQIPQQEGRAVPSGSPPQQQFLLLPPTVTPRPAQCRNRKGKGSPAPQKRPP